MGVQGFKTSMFALIIFSFVVLMFWLDRFASSNNGPKFQQPGITHLVMFEFRANASVAQINMVCHQMLALKDTCFRPNTKMPYILTASGGRNNSREELTNGKSHAFVMEFANVEDRDYYVEKDPVHRSFIDSLGPFVAGAQVIDFVPGVF